MYVNRGVGGWSVLFRALDEEWLAPLVTVGNILRREDGGGKLTEPHVLRYKD